MTASQTVLEVREKTEELKKSLTQMAINKNRESYCHK